MRIGILEADKVIEGLRSEFGSYADMFEAWLNHSRDNLSFSRYDVTAKIYPENVRECDAYIITGSRASVLEQEEWMAPLSQFVCDIISSKKKLLGFCFGHQLIATTLGGEVGKSPCGWRAGLSRDVVYQSRSWMKPAVAHFAIPVIHQEQVIRLPEEATPISGNNDCRYGTIQYGSTTLTFQGHPEHRRGYTRSLLLVRQHLMADSFLWQALESLQHVDDNCLVGNWVINFLDS